MIIVQLYVEQRSSAIAQLLKEAGHQSARCRGPFLPIHVSGLISEPTSGVDCSNHTVGKHQIIGADSLTYLSIDGLIDSIGIETDVLKWRPLVMAYFDGKYPTLS